MNKLTIGSDIRVVQYLSIVILIIEANGLSTISTAYFLVFIAEAVADTLDGFGDECERSCHVRRNEALRTEIKQLWSENSRRKETEQYETGDNGILNFIASWVFLRAGTLQFSQKI